jgi:hypothetical protein
LVSWIVTGSGSAPSGGSARLAPSALSRPFARPAAPALAMTSPTPSAVPAWSLYLNPLLVDFHFTGSGATASSVSRVWLGPA